LFCSGRGSSQVAASNSGVSISTMGAIAMVRMIIRTMNGTIPGLGTGTVGMDIRTISNQRIETRPSTDGARLLFSQIKFRAVKAHAAVGSKSREVQIAFIISLMCCFALPLICWNSWLLPNSPRLRSTISKSLSISCISPVSSPRIFPVSNFNLD
jgi:hypothetical protein